MSKAVHCSKGHILVCAMMKIPGKSLETPPEAAKKFPSGKNNDRWKGKKNDPYIHAIFIHIQKIKI